MTDRTGARHASAAIVMSVVRTSRENILALLRGRLSNDGRGCACDERRAVWVGRNPAMGARWGRTLRATVRQSETLSTTISSASQRGHIVRVSANVWQGSPARLAYRLVIEPTPYASASAHWT